MYSAIAVGLFVSVADHGSVSVALPSIADDFGIALPTAQWVMVGYALTISCLLLPMGRLSDIVGRKRLYVAGFTIFLAAATLCALANDALTLIGARVFMGVGAAMTQATSTAILLSSFDASERGRALGLQMSAVGAGAVAGPTVGGFAVEALGWQGVFYLTIVLGALNVLVAQAVIKRDGGGGSEGAQRFDAVGAATSTAMLIVFLLAMSSAAEAGWLSPSIIAAFACVAALAGVFVAWELRSPSPMLDVSLFRHKVFAIGVASSAISFMGISSVRFLLPFYLQAVLGYSPARVGLTLIPSAFAMIIMGPLGGRLSDRFGWTPFNVGGLVFGACGLLILSAATQTTPVWLIVIGTVTQSMGTGIFNAPNNSSILSVVDASRYGVMTGFLNLVRNSANIIGIAAATTIVVAVMGMRGLEPSLSAVGDAPAGGVFAAFTSGMKTVYLGMAGLLLVGAALSALKGARNAAA